jgi:serine/threonine protein kinase/tetratricopeptide (TPR) repeat protein/TolB-like protein
MIGRELGQYRIVEKIGAGGMGVVYRAHDEQLDRDVALKVLPAGLLADETARKQFRKEALALAKLNHPNIETVYAFSSQEGVDFLAMELIPGELLSEKIKEGPLPQQEIIRLGSQLAEGLSAAHDQGIIHRDLNPKNIFVTPDGRLKILDFGLAKILQPELANDVTRSVTVETGTVSGTVPYMAPEQLRGEATDERSDIYAAGAVLYEMATGRRPFPQTPGPQLMGAILHQSPPPPSQLNPHVMPALESVILQTLEKEPGQRYQTTGELLVALKSISGSAASAPVDAAVVGSKAGASRGSKIYLGSVVLLVIFGLGLILGLNVYGSRDRLLRRNRAAPTSTPVYAPVKMRRSVAVLGFKNISGRPEQAWISTALSEMLTTELAAGEQLRTVPGETVAQTKKSLALPDADSYGKETLGKIRSSLNADDVVLGSYVPLGEGQIRLDVRLQDTAEGETLASVSEKGGEDQIDDLVSRAGTDLRAKLGAGAVSASQAVAVRAALPTTSEAARLYAEGVAKMRAVDNLAARDSLQRAVAAEPKFPLAHAMLAEAWSNLGYDNKAREEAKTAVELARNLPREEQLSIEARFAEFSKDWDKAIGSYRALWSFFPDNPDYGVRLAMSQVASGKAKEALETVATLRKLPAPAAEDPRIDIAEAVARERLADFADAYAIEQKLIEKARGLGSRLLLAQALRQEAWALWNMGQPEKSEAAAEEAQRLFAEAGDRDGLAKTLNMMGIIYFRQSDFPRATKAHEQSLAIARGIANQRGIRQALNNLAIVQLSEGNYLRAEATLKESVALAREIGDKSGEHIAIDNLAVVASQRGDLAGAKSLYEQQLAMAHELGDKKSVAYALAGLGDVSEMSGDLKDARKKYEESLGIRKELGITGMIADAQESLGMILVEAGEAPAGEGLCRGAREDFRKEQSGDSEMIADACLAQALLAQKKVREARNEIEASKELTKKSQNYWYRAAMSIAAARTAMASGQLAEARKSLETALAEAKEKNCLPYQFEARLALGELEMKSGKSTSGRARLAALERDATGKGFLLIVRRAHAAAG